MTPKFREDAVRLLDSLNFTSTAREVEMDRLDAIELMKLLHRSKMIFSPEDAALLEDLIGQIKASEPEAPHESD